MNEDDVRLVRQIVREELHEALETELYDALFTMLDAFESGIINFKQHFARNKGTEEKPERVWSWDPTKINWVEVQGSSGPYQRYPPEGKKIEATVDYKNLIEDLKAHNGKLSRKDPDGSVWFYWLFRDSVTIGRKRR